MTRAQQIAMFARSGKKGAPKRQTLKERAATIASSRRPSQYNPQTLYPAGHKGNKASNKPVTPKRFASKTGPTFPSNPGYSPGPFSTGKSPWLAPPPKQQFKMRTMEFRKGRDDKPGVKMYANANTAPPTALQGQDLINWLFEQAHGGHGASKGPDATRPAHHDPKWDKKWPMQTKTIPIPPLTPHEARAFPSKTRKKKAVAVKYGMNTESHFPKPVLPQTKKLPPVKAGPKTYKPVDTARTWWSAQPDNPQ